MSDRLKCRFCDWSTVKKYSNKQGKFRGVDSAQQRMLDHVQEKHPEEFEKIQQQMQEHYGLEGE